MLPIKPNHLNQTTTIIATATTATMVDILEIDVLIIGAGISGIYTSKLYLDLHPNARLVILYKDSCVGGVWNSRRGYDSFWTQWIVGTAEFSDQPMPQPPDEDLSYDFFKAKHTTKYLESYFSTEVQSVRKVDGKWTVLATELASEEVPSDVLCGTGWVPSLQFFSEDQCQELGLTHLLDQESIDKKALWENLEERAEHKVLATFPQLANPPPHYHKPPSRTPYRLYRHIIPISESGKSVEDRPIVFIGQVGLGNYFPSAKCQSLWAMAYLDGKLDLLSHEGEKQVALFTAWCRCRHLSNGTEGNNMAFELVGYIDTLMQDLHLNSYRKGRFEDLFSPF